MADIVLSPLNDFAVTVLLQNVHATTGVITAITTGTVTGTLATSKAPDAAAADAAFTVSMVHVGDSGTTYANGTWLYQLDAAALTIALLDTHFLNKPPILIVSRTNDVRRYFELVYSRSRAMVQA